MAPPPLSPSSSQPCRPLTPLSKRLPTRPGLTWSSAAAALLAARPPVVPPQATDHLLAVRDPVSFRIAISVAVQNATRPPVLDQLITETRAALQPAAGPAAAYAWFERRASYPPPPQSPHGPAPTPQHQPHLPPSPAAPLPYPPPPLPPGPQATGLLPPSFVDAPHVIRLRGLRHIPDATQASSALTHHVGAPVTIPATALRDGSHFVSVPADQFRALFASAPTRPYVDPHHHYTITLDSRTASGEPFYLPDSPIKPPPKKKLKGPKARRAGRQLDAMPPPDHPPPGFHTTTSATAAPSTSAQAPRAYGTLPHTRDAPHTSQRITPYHGSRVN